MTLTAFPEVPRKGAAAEAAAVQAEARRVAAELAPPARHLMIRVRPVMAFLAAAVALVVFLSLVQDLLIFLAPEAGFSDRIYRLDLHTEASLPTWFSSGILGTGERREGTAGDRTCRKRG